MSAGHREKVKRKRGGRWWERVKRMCYHSGLPLYTEPHRDTGEGYWAGAPRFSEKLQINWREHEAVCRRKGWGRRRNYQPDFVPFFASVQFSRSVVSDSLWPHESQHAMPSCPSPTPWVHSDSGPSSQWCHPAISSSVVPFSSRPQSLPASESFPMSQLFAWGGQSTGVSPSLHSLYCIYPGHTLMTTQKVRSYPL